MSARFAIVLLALLLILGGMGGCFAYLGYFGGPVLTFVPATGRPAPSKAHLAAVILSGDMGLKVGMAPRIAERLAADGIPVIGVNSLTYFRNGRTPAEVEALLSDLTRRALSFGHADQVVLIGQSFGGDVLHVGLAGLPHGLRAKVRMAAFVVPTDTVLLTASPSEIFTWAIPGTAAMTTARQLDWTPVTCIYGVEETATLCPLWRQPNVHVVGLPGGHPLHGDVDAIHAVLSKAIDASVSDDRHGK
ncbi:virulence factor [Sphingobium sufflavum]|uniref:virulence factor n=1 Tax=Sphingobium sufflavum TaxID=1129547 RepID=UPI001F412C92|nr:virulence factor [Sphingobium sufflavum]MCE7796434.1 virulence factor [Sphingobium sufflavum]